MEESFDTVQEEAPAEEPCMETAEETPAVKNLWHCRGNSAEEPAMETAEETPAVKSLSALLRKLLRRTCHGNCRRDSGFEESFENAGESGVESSRRFGISRSDPCGHLG